jgi:hypothetical protein
MATHLVESIQKKLGFPPLLKIDPNIQEAKEKVLRQSQEKLAQAAIPAVLTALYKFTRTDEGCNTILQNADSESWLNTIYEGKQEMAVDKVSHYAGVSRELAESAMKKVANEAVISVKNSNGNHPTGGSIRSFMDVQRHNILVYLPAAMQMGDLLNDEALDDRTNKMEGPVSGFMHRIENMLSKGDKSKYP